MLAPGCLHPRGTPCWHRTLPRACDGSPCCASSLRSPTGGSQSPGESVLRLRWVQAGLMAPTPQFEVWRDGTLIAVLDLANETLRYAAEYDGVEWHSSAEQVEHDRLRRRDVSDEDWLIDVFSAADLYGPAANAEVRLRIGSNRAQAASAVQRASRRAESAYICADSRLIPRRRCRVGVHIRRLGVEPGLEDDLAGLAAGAEELEGLVEDDLGLLVGAALLHVGEVGLVGLDLGRRGRVLGVEGRGEPALGGSPTTRGSRPRPRT